MPQTTSWVIWIELMLQTGFKPVWGNPTGFQAHLSNTEQSIFTAFIYIFLPQLSCSRQGNTWDVISASFICYFGHKHQGWKYTVTKQPQTFTDKIHAVEKNPLNYWGIFIVWVVETLLYHWFIFHEDCSDYQPEWGGCFNVAGPRAASLEYRAASTVSPRLIHELSHLHSVHERDSTLAASQLQKQIDTAKQYWGKKWRGMF